MQLLRGMAYLHTVRGRSPADHVARSLMTCFLSQNSILHRDIKPANILVHRGVVQIADFGLARLACGAQERKSAKGELMYTNEVVTRWYRAPELLLGTRSYGFGVDLWSVG